ncbi:Bdr family repetitive protein [Borreliella carolinensis]|uniref:Bdr family repetitive protein n=1 Tax=Borreliella carolinensis TaxID=478174 RepID=UPI003AF0F4F5
METLSTSVSGISQEQIYKEFLRLGMEQLIAQDLSKRYYHNELTYRDLENLEKQFDIKFDNLIFKIDTSEKNLNAKIENVKNELNAKIENVKNELNTKIDNVEKNLNLKIDGLNIKIDNVEKNLMSLSEMLKWVLGIMGAMSITMIAGLIFAFISK